MYFWISNWISGFVCEFLISLWISGFRVGFLDFWLDFRVSFWISQSRYDFSISIWISGYGAGVLKRRVCELFDRVFQSHCRSKSCENGSATWYYLMREDRETLYLDSSLGNTLCKWVPNIGGGALAKNHSLLLFMK